MSYDRYKKFRHDGKIGVIPMVKLPVKSTDYYIEYELGVTRLDRVSYQYYNDPNYDWLILLANPEVSGLEYEIPDGTVLRIPYPLKLTLEQYQDKIDRYEKLYGSI